MVDLIKLTKLQFPHLKNENISITIYLKRLL